MGAGQYVSLLVPEAQAERMKGMAAAFGVEDRISIFAAERFVSQLLTGLSIDSGRHPADILRDVVRAWKSGSPRTDSSRSRQRI